MYNNTLSEEILIKSKFVKQDKGGKNYLILNTDKGKVIVFHKNFPEPKWAKLKVGQKYHCELGEGKNDKKLLLGIKNITTFTYEEGKITVNIISDYDDEETPQNGKYEKRRK